MYVAYLVRVDDRRSEIALGEFKKLSPALVRARAACYEHGADVYDWVVDKLIGSDAEDLKLVQRRSSVGGFEPL